MTLTHVGLIPDGLRRWAHANNSTLADSYLRGADKVGELLLALRRNGVQTASVYNLSRANLARSSAELDAVYAASVYFFSILLPTYFNLSEITVRLHGDRALLPEEYVAAANALEAQTTGAGFQINVLAAYDAYDELRDAQARAKRQNCDIEDALEIPDLDLVIRTTADPILSGFLPLQSQYAKLVFLNTPLNELTASSIDDIIDEYRDFPRRRGR